MYNIDPLQVYPFETVIHLTLMFAWWYVYISCKPLHYFYTIQAVNFCDEDICLSNPFMPILSIFSYFYSFSQILYNPDWSSEIIF